MYFHFLLFSRGELFLLSKRFAEKRSEKDHCASPFLLLCRANLTEADLSYADMRGVDLSGVNLKKARLNHARFDQATLSANDLGAVDHPTPEETLTRASLHTSVA